MIHAMLTATIACFGLSLFVDMCDEWYEAFLRHQDRIDDDYFVRFK